LKKRVLTTQFVLFSVMNLKLSILEKLYDYLRIEMLFTGEHGIDNGNFMKLGLYNYFNTVLDTLESKSTETFIDDISEMKYFIGIDGLISIYEKKMSNIR